MNVLFQLCSAVSVGVILGFLCGGIKSLARRGRPYSQDQTRRTGRILKVVSAGIKYLTFLLLALGFIWCVYYLILGAVVPAQAEYATSMSQLIVSVLTVISILFAFFEFLRRSDGKDE